MENSVCCVIISYNPDISIKNNVKAILNQVNEVLIVDNGSVNNVDLLKDIERKEKISVVYNGTNLGIAAALNIGIRYAIKNNYKWVLTLDQDSESINSMVKNMLSKYEEFNENDKKEVVSIFPSYIERGYLDEQSDNIINCVNKQNNSSEEKIDSLKDVHYTVSEITSGNLVKTEVFSNVGFFEEKLFIDYVDHEFCLRLRMNRYKMIQVENAYLLHKLGNSQKKKVLFKEVNFTNHSYTRRYYITRNRIYVWGKYFKYYPKFIIGDIIAFLKEFIKIILFEENKKMKLKMINLGIKDNINSKYGNLS